MMKQKLILFILLTFILSVATQQANPQIRKTTKMVKQKVKRPVYAIQYLRCKGGKIAIAVMGCTIQFRVSFKKASNHLRVNDGECAWSNRPLNASERATVWLSTRKNKINMSYNPNNSQGAIILHNTIDPRIKKIVQAIKNNRVYKLIVNKDNYAFTIAENQPYL